MALRQELRYLFYLWIIYMSKGSLSIQSQRLNSGDLLHVLLVLWNTGEGYLNEKMIMGFQLTNTYPVLLENVMTLAEASESKWVTVHFHSYYSIV